MLKILNHTDSTNNYAMQLVREGMAKHGMGIAALEQTAGKGQRGKTWQAQAGTSIALSVIIKTEDIKPERQFCLSMAVALAALHFVKKYISTDLAIKWPNDLYWRDRKAGGILIENAFKGSKWQWAVAGIGINVNQLHFNKKLPNPVSLQQITNRHFDITKLLHELYADILNRVEALENVSDSKLLKEYNRHLFRLNQKVKLKKGSHSFETTITGVNLHGQLHTKDVLERTFDFGEVQWLL